MNTRNELNESPVRFDAGAHTYQLGDIMLNGVTPIVNWVFNKTYEGIPADVLAKAAEHGTAVHLACQTWDETGLLVNEFRCEVEEYKRLLSEGGLKPLLSEYLVSDNEELASSIDKVFEPTDGAYPLGDIENVTLQLSIYAVLFELQNPMKKAGRLFCFWLPKEQYGKATLYEVQRIPTDVVAEIILHYQFDELREWCQAKVMEYCPEVPVAVDGTLPLCFQDIEREVARLETEAKKMKEKSEELRAGLLREMQKAGKFSWEGEYLTLSRRKATTRVTLDSTKVKKLYPDVYAECQKTSEVSESLTIKIK